MSQGRQKLNDVVRSWSATRGPSTLHVHEPPPRSVADCSTGASTSAARLEELGRKVAEEAAFLDSSPADDGLMAEFNARLESEGGKEVFKIKQSVAEASDVAKEGADKIKGVAEGAADAAGGLLSRLTPQQRNIATIILGLIGFQLLIGSIGSALSGGGQDGYVV